MYTLHDWPAVCRLKVDCSSLKLPFFPILSLLSALFGSKMIYIGLCPLNVEMEWHSTALRSRFYSSEKLNAVHHTFIETNVYMYSYIHSVFFYLQCQVCGGCSSIQELIIAKNVRFFRFTIFLTITAFKLTKRQSETKRDSLSHVCDISIYVM